MTSKYYKTTGIPGTRPKISTAGQPRTLGENSTGMRQDPVSYSKEQAFLKKLEMYQSGALPDAAGVCENQNVSVTQTHSDQGEFLSYNKLANYQSDARPDAAGVCENQNVSVVKTHSQEEAFLKKMEMYQSGARPDAAGVCGNQIVHATQFAVRQEISIPTPLDRDSSVCDKPHMKQGERTIVVTRLSPPTVTKTVHETEKVDASVVLLFGPDKLPTDVGQRVSETESRLREQVLVLQRENERLKQLLPSEVEEAKKKETKTTITSTEPSHSWFFSLMFLISWMFSWFTPCKRPAVAVVQPSKQAVQDAVHEEAKNPDEVVTATKPTPPAPKSQTPAAQTGERPSRWNVFALFSRKAEPAVVSAPQTATQSALPPQTAPQGAPPPPPPPQTAPQGAPPPPPPKTAPQGAPPPPPPPKTAPQGGPPPQPPQKTTAKSSDTTPDPKQSDIMDALKNALAKRRVAVETGEIVNSSVKTDSSVTRQNGVEAQTTIPPPNQMLGFNLVKSKKSESVQSECTEEEWAADEKKQENAPSAKVEPSTQPVMKTPTPSKKPKNRVSFIPQQEFLSELSQKLAKRAEKIAQAEIDAAAKSHEASS